MSRPSLIFDTVDFGYNQAELVVHGLTLHLTPGWTAIVGVNGAGKSTLLGLAAGGLQPLRGAVRAPARVHLCDQRTDRPSPDLLAFAEAGDRSAGRWRSMLGIEGDWLPRWASLSHGERKRLQVAAALWQEPDLLALDEPTNHLDASTAAGVRNALATYRGIGLLVSHDRVLLDALCTATIVSEGRGWRHVPLRPSAARAAVADEARALRRARDVADAEVARLARVAQQRADVAAQSARRLSKRHLARGDRDGRARIDRARVSGRDTQAGRLVRQMEQRVASAEARVAGLAIERQFTTGISLATQRSPRCVLADVGPCDLPLGPSRRLRVPRLVLGSADRICIAGTNGSGKSTLVRALVEALGASGTRTVFVPQEFTSAEGLAILDDVRSRAPEARGRLMTLVRRLGSDPEALLASAQPSPGEVRKLAVAIGLDERIEAIVLDEPTNHLDLPSIEALETALAGASCALVLVSHDLAFIERLTTTTWEVGDGLVVATAR